MRVSGTKVPGKMGTYKMTSNITVKLSVAAILMALIGMIAITARTTGSEENNPPARGMFLVASRQIKDPLFMESVVLLLKVDQSGAMGLIMNKPSDKPLSDLFPEMRKADQKHDRLHLGGPVGTNQLFMLLRSKGTVKDTVRILDGVALSAEQSVLSDALKKKRAGSEYRLFAGYSGWMTGQLEWEIRRGDWHILAADAATVFYDDASKVWPLLYRKAQEIMVQQRMRDHPGSSATGVRPTDELFGLAFMR